MNIALHYKTALQKCTTKALALLLVVNNVDAAMVKEGEVAGAGPGIGKTHEPPNFGARPPPRRRVVRRPHL